MVFNDDSAIFLSFDIKNGKSDVLYINYYVFGTQNKFLFNFGRLRSFV